MTRLADALPRYRKFLVALAGALVQLVLLLQDLIGSGLLHGKALATAQLALATLTALGVRQASNTDTSEPGVPDSENSGADEAAPLPASGAIDEFAEHVISNDSDGRHQPKHTAAGD